MRAVTCYVFKNLLNHVTCAYACDESRWFVESFLLFQVYSIQNKERVSAHKKNPDGFALFVGPFKAKAMHAQALTSAVSSVGGHRSA